jgi:hypothetical protein
LGIGGRLRRRRLHARRFRRPGQRLGQIAGRFILSVNEVPETREIFRFGIETVATRYNDEARATAR